MGIGLEFEKAKSRGMADAQRPIEAAARIRCPMNAIVIVLKEEQIQVQLIGFSGTP